MGRFQTVLAARERRKARRYDVDVKGLVKVDAEPTARTCAIHDISETGALIEVAHAESLREFTLSVSRRCRVVRRSEDGGKIGVEFLVPWPINPRPMAGQRGEPSRKRPRAIAGE